VALDGFSLAKRQSSYWLPLFTLAAMRRPRRHLPGGRISETKLHCVP
jgi:hypothetical protein